MIGEGFDIKKYRARQVPCPVFSGNVTMLLARRGHARVDNLNFRVVAVLNQLLVRSDRPDQAMLVSLAGLITTMMLLVREISSLFDLIKSLFGF